MALPSQRARVDLLRCEPDLTPVLEGRFYALASDEVEIFFALRAGQSMSLGCRYVNGSGTEVDLGKARYWFERAAAKGDETAQGTSRSSTARREHKTEIKRPDDTIGA
ncbi:hypothetical protein JL720_16022 [Aureococcus anophagefferens]|nr:hypothetical protein JL720_16022 [Aureococcus anophagefferens]